MSASQGSAQLSQPTEDRLLESDNDIISEEGQSVEQGCVIWLTGLPSSGKSTIGNSLAKRLRLQGLKVEILDGDDIRKCLSADLGFSAEDRQEHNRRVIYISKLLSRNGITVIVPLIAPYKETREFARRELARYVEVYVKCPVEECIRRDVKGLYAKALRGELLGFTGISDPYEEPSNPEITVETDVLTLRQCMDRIINVAIERGYLNGTFPHHTDEDGEKRGRL